MTSHDSLDSRSLLEKAYEKLLPALGYLHSSVAGFAASVVVFATWAARRMMTEKRRVTIELEKDYQEYAMIERKIRRKTKDLEMLKRTLPKVTDPRRRALLERKIKLLESEIDSLYQHFELIGLRIMAVQKLLELKEMGVLGRIEKIVRDLEEGKADRDLYDLLAELEEKWRNRELTKGVIERMLEA